MAKQTYKNEGGHVHVHVRDGEGTEVPVGGSYTADDVTEKHAARVSGFSVQRTSTKEEEK